LGDIKRLFFRIPRMNGECWDLLFYFLFFHLSLYLFLGRLIPSFFVVGFDTPLLLWADDLLASATHVPFQFRGS
jgi:hypothetical protein